MFRLKRILITARKISSCTLATGTVCTTVSEPTYSVRQTARGFLQSLGLSQPTGSARNQWHSSTRSVIRAVSKAPAVSFSREMVGAFAEIRKWQSACFASGGPRGFAFQSVDLRTMRSPSHGRMDMRSYANDAAKTLKVCYHGILEDLHALMACRIRTCPGLRCFPDRRVFLHFLSSYSLTGL